LKRTEAGLSGGDSRLNPVVLPRYAGFGRQVKFMESGELVGMPLFEAEPTSPAAKKFLELAKWYVDFLRTLFGQEKEIDLQQRLPM
jgi:hypothetical protein